MHKSKKNPDSWMEDGDSAHWVTAKKKKKRVSPSDAHSSAKYSGKEKSSKKVTKKVSGKR
jgi:hypothetical protein